MNTIEERIADAFDQLELPDTDLVSGVLSEISTSAPGGNAFKWPSPLLVAAVLAAVVCAASLIIQPTREALASWLGIGATRVEFVDPSTTDQGAAEPESEAEEAEPPQTTAETALTTEADSALDSSVRNPIPTLGSPATVDDIEVGSGRRFGWASTASLPALPGSTAGAMLSVRSVDGPLDLKLLSSDESVQMVTVDLDGGPVVGMWIASDHQYLAAADERPTQAEQVLIWVVDDVQYRLEAELPRARMIELAEQTAHGTDLLQPG